jgi:hypothetical protein
MGYTTSLRGPASESDGLVTKYAAKAKPCILFCRHVKSAPLLTEPAFEKTLALSFCKDNEYCVEIYVTKYQAGMIKKRNWKQWLTK